MLKLRQNGPWVLFLAIVLCSVEHQLWGWNWNSVPDMGDLYSYFVPFWKFFRSSILQGEIPLWMDSQELGFPFAYNPQCSLFYLPNYVLLLPLNIGVRIYLQMPFVMLFVGFFLIVRKAHFSSWYAAVGSALLSINGVVIGLFSMTTVLHTIAWLPWLMLAFSGFGRRLSSWILPLVLAQSFLAGAWDVWIFLVVIAFVSTNGWKQGVWYLAASGVRSLGIVAPQVLMTLSYLPLTIRKDAVAISETLFWSSGWHHLMGLVSPNVQQSSLGSNVWFEVLGQRPGWTLSTYLSAPLVALLPLAFYWLAKRNKLLLITLVGLFLISASGSISILAKWLSKFDISLPIRYPDKLLPVILITLGYCVVLSAPILFRLGRRVKFWMIASSVMWSGFLLALFPFARQWFLDSCLPPYRADVNVIVGQRLLYEYFTTRDSIVFLFISMGALGILTWIKPVKTALTLLVLVGVMDVLLAGTKWGGVREVEREVPSELTSVMGKESLRFFILDAYTHEQVLDSAKAEIRTLAKKDAFAWLAWNPDGGDELGWMALNGMNVLPLRSSRVLTGLFEVQPDSVRAEILWRSGVSWCLGDTSRIKQILNDTLDCYNYWGRAVACRIENGGLARWHERYYWSDSTRESSIRMFATERDRNAAYLLVDSGQHVPKSKIVDHVVQPVLPQNKQGHRLYAIPEGHSGGVLVVTSSYHEDWRATDQAGNPLPIVIADYAMTGVLIPEGTTTVSLHFSSWRFFRGCILGLGILLGSFVGLRKWV